MKMRVMYSSKKGKVATYAEAIGQACGCLTNDIPPAYPADKERLVIIGVTLKGEPEEKQLKEILRTAGTNVIDDTYYIKCGIFGKKITLEERQAIVDWARKIQNIVSESK